MLSYLSSCMFNRGLYKIMRWEIAGFFWIVIVGSLLHFTYEWSGESPIVGAFSPVNESVWEHLKLGYFALLFFMIIEYFAIRKYTSSFFLGKLSGILFMEVFIVVFHYNYKSIFGKHIFILDIFAFIVGSIICQFISRLILTKNISTYINTLSFLLFIGIGIFLIYTTFYPFELPIFKDPSTGKYGI